MELTNIKNIVEAAWNNRELLENTETRTAIRGVIELLNKGTLRVA